MAATAWSPVSAGVPAFNVFRRDDTVVRALQGSQVALHEYRTAFDNLLAQATGDRERWQQEKADLENSLRHTTIRTSEAERRMKEHLSGMNHTVSTLSDALTQLETQHQSLQDNSTEKIEQLSRHAEALDQAVTELQGERQQLQGELSEAQAEASLKEGAVRHAAQLEAVIGAMQQRAKHLVKDLERDKSEAHQRVGELSSHLATTQQQLAEQAAARVASEDASLRLALEHQRLAAALQLERLINEPLRNTHYARTTTLAHVMRSPIAATVRDRSTQPLDLHSAVSPQHYTVPTHPDHLTVPHLGTASSAAAAGGAAGVYGGTAAAYGGPAGGPLHNALLVTRPNLSGALAGKDLTRLSRSWATTTAAAGLPHPAFADNLGSPISPPPPGPPRTPAPKVVPYLPFHSPPPPPPAAASGAGSGGYVVPRYLTSSTPRSPQSGGAQAAGAAGRAAERSGSGNGRPWGAAVSVVSAAPRAGRPAMRAPIGKASLGSGDALGTGPYAQATLVYG